MFSPKTFAVLFVFTLGSLSYAQFNDAELDQIALLARGDDAADLDFASAFYGRDADPESEPEPEPESEPEPEWGWEWQRHQARGELDSICVSSHFPHLKT